MAMSVSCEGELGQSSSMGVGIGVRVCRGPLWPSGAV